MLCADRGVCALLGFPVDAATVGQALLAGALLIAGVLSLLSSRTSRSRPATLVALVGCFCGWYLWPRGPPAAHDDCTRLVARTLDRSPQRSPQAVHTALLARLVGQDVAEVGSRAGDGIACFAQRARSAIAIETKGKRRAPCCMSAREISRSAPAPALTSFVHLLRRTTCTRSPMQTPSRGGPLCRKQARYAGASQTAGWPRLAEARGSLMRHDLALQAASGEPVGRRLRDLDIGGPRHR